MFFDIAKEDMDSAIVLNALKEQILDKNILMESYTHSLATILSFNLNPKKTII
jgi:hypothetical protein